MKIQLWPPLCLEFLSSLLISLGIAPCTLARTPAGTNFQKFLADVRILELRTPFSASQLINILTN
jgi:hypothetical protein